MTHMVYMSPPTKVVWMEMLEGSIAVTFSITSVFRGKGGEIFYVKGGSGKEIV